MNNNKEITIQLDEGCSRGLFSKITATCLIEEINNLVIIAGYNNAPMKLLKSLHLADTNNYEVTLQDIKNQEIYNLTIPHSEFAYKVNEGKQKIVQMKDVAKGDVISRYTNGSNCVKITELESYNDSRGIHMTCRNLDTGDNNHYGFIKPAELVWLFDSGSLSIDSKKHTLLNVSNLLDQMDMDDLSDHNKKIVLETISILSSAKKDPLQ